MMANFQEFKSDFLRRCRDHKVTRWIRFGLVALVYLLWCIWMHNAWLLLGLVLLFDIYITGYIPFTWWKKSKNKGVRKVMSWVDAIVYALVLVYFIFNFIGQNYQIPSSSLEKTLLTGDYLFVNKTTYGPRVPITPVHFPLAHNKMPIIGGDSYLEHPQTKYKRLKGLRNVELGDIVVFNFPAGDTVTTKTEETGPDYYTLVKQYGWKEVNTNKQAFGKVKYRPVDRRTNYVKRAVGLPGQRFKIVDDIIMLDGQPFKQPENVQFNYVIQTTRPLSDEYRQELDINADEIYPLEPIDGMHTYYLPLTSRMIERMKSDGFINQYERAQLGTASLFPEGLSESWTLSNYGGEEGIWIPKKGETIKLTPEIWPLYERVIRNYEGHTNSFVKDGKVFVDGKPVENYTFDMDYYFMMGDNRDNSLDSRFWGFVPEDHIVGTPMIVLISFDKNKGIFNGGIRWNRIFHTANPDK